MLLRAVLPMQVNASINTSVNVKYKTLEEVTEEARKLGLPERRVFELTDYKRIEDGQDEPPALSSCSTRRCCASRPSGPGRRRASTSSRFGSTFTRTSCGVRWVQRVRFELQQFYEDFLAGRAPQARPASPPPIIRQIERR